MIAEFGSNHETCMCWMALDAVPLAIDLRDGLGEKILDIAVEEMLASVYQQRAPDTGEAWADDKESTTRQKGHGSIGWKTGAMMRPQNWRGGMRIIDARRLNWYWTGPEYGRYFSEPKVPWQEPRHIVGWTDHAQEEAERLIADAVQQLDEGPDDHQAGADGDPSTWEPWGPGQDNKPD